jgi:CheY-like chemotaxis protein
VSKTRVAAELVPAIRCVAGGGVWFDQVEHASESTTSARTWKILVAAHERPIRSLLCEALPKIGCSVTMAWRQDEIIRSLEREPFDLLLIDHRLPGRLCGATLLEEVSGRHPNLPILFLTTSPGDLAHYRPCSNIQGVVTKPLSIPQLQAEVGRALSWSHAQVPASL